MATTITVIGILLIVMAVFLVISVLMQSSKDHRLGGSIAGGAETFFGKTKGKSLDAMFNKLTTVVAIIFVVLVIVLYVIQPEPERIQYNNPGVVSVEDDAASDANLEAEAPEADVEAPEAETEAEAEVEAEAEAEAPAEDEVEAAE
ncbi:MAG: preprotein translocase subunit SecG [Clostridia bacterium]|nr:preprotein translocase subunit SecG [Clostridia bacterium]